MIKLEITFDTKEELLTFLTPDQVAAALPSTTSDTPEPPVKKKAAVKKSVKKKAAAPKAVDDLVDTTVEAQIIEMVALRAQLGKDMIAKNNAFNDNNVTIVAFIKEFGVNRLSELADDRLVEFSDKLELL